MLLDIDGRSVGVISGSIVVDQVVVPRVASRSQVARSQIGQNRSDARLRLIGAVHIRAAFIAVAFVPVVRSGPWFGSNNWYKRDGYESGSYVNCADQSQPGVAPILAYLRSRHLQSRCDPGHYYLVNNYGPAYDADGTPVDVKQHPYTLP